MAKICLITSFVFNHGGEQRVSVVIANELAKKNQVIIYSQDAEADYEKNPYGLDKKIEVRKINQPEFGAVNRILRRLIREVNERTNWFYKKEKYYKLLEYAYFQKAWQEQMLAEYTKESYDVIMAVSGGNTIQLGLIADRLPCKTVGWEHNAYEAYFETQGYYFWHQDVLFKRALKNLDSCVVLNHRICEQYKSAFEKECDVIYNPRSFVSEEKSPLAQKTFVTCGRIIRQKGYDLLIESFKEFAEWNKDWNLVIVGEGEMRPEVEKKISEYQLSDRITITGYQNDVISYLKHASCYVLSSRWEGFPMVLTEAFEMGLPVVSYDISAVEPLVTGGKEGLLAEAYDTKQFAQKMLEITKMSDEELNEMAHNAIEKAESLAIEKIIVQWKNLLEAE